MGVFLSSFPNPFSSTPSFKDFAVAAHNARADDHLICEDGHVFSKSRQYQYDGSKEKINQKAWDAFTRAIDNTFTETKKNQICSRYHINLKELKKSSHSLEKRYVECFGVGNAAVTLADLQEAQDSKAWFSRSLRRASVEEISRLYSQVTLNNYLGDMENPRKISGSPRGQHESFVLDPCEMDRQRGNLFLGIAELRSNNPNIPSLHPYYCRLSMAITCLLETSKDIKNSDLIIPAPGRKEGELDFYRVYDIISAGGLTAVALVPVSDESSLQPVVSFRCTKQSFAMEEALKSLLNNLEKNIGESGYKAAKPFLKALMEDRNFTRGKKPKVLCFSQGGAYAGYFLQDFVKQIGEFIGFNFVGSDARVVEDIAKQINELPDYEVPPAFSIYRVKGDWVNKVGEKHIGWGIEHPNSRVRVVEFAINDFPAPSDNVYDPNEVLKWFNVHGARPMDSAYDYEESIYTGKQHCNQILDTYNRDRTLEDIRRQLGHKIMYRLIGSVYYFLNFLLRIFDIETFRKNMR